MCIKKQRMISTIPNLDSDSEEIEIPQEVLDEMDAAQEEYERNLEEALEEELNDALDFGEDDG